MQIITINNPGFIPVNDANTFVQTINSYINDYNQEPDPTVKIDILKDLQFIIKTFDHRYSQGVLASSLDYINIYEQLFLAIQAENIALQVSLHKPTMLATLLANISPSKGNYLLYYLMKSPTVQGLKNNLFALYDSHDNTHEANYFRHFLNNHQIKVLGVQGNDIKGNSRNLLITSPQGLKQVLRVENTPGDLDKFSPGPKVDDYLRTHLPASYFDAIEEERYFIFYEKNTVVRRAISVTEYFPEGDLYTYSRKIPPDQLLDSTCEYFGQLIEMLMRMQAHHFFFPDSKIKNILIRTNGELAVSDCKSLIYSSTDTFAQNIYAIISTSTHVPPEHTNPVIDNVDAFHAYIVGRNLHLYLSPEKNQDDYVKNNFPPPKKLANFCNYPIFTNQGALGYQGKVFYNLILALTNANPNQRMPLQEAFNRLFILRSQYTATINTLRNISQEIIFHYFINAQEALIVQKSTLAEKKEALNNLTYISQLLTELKKDNAVDINKITEFLTQFSQSALSPNFNYVELIARHVFLFNDIDTAKKLYNSLKVMGVVFDNQLIKRIINSYPDPQIQQQIIAQLSTLDPFQAAIFEIEGKALAAISSDFLLNLLAMHPILLQQNLPFNYSTTANRIVNLTLLESLIAISFSQKNTPLFEKIVNLATLNKVTIDTQTLKKVSLIYDAPDTVDDWLNQQLVMVSTNKEHQANLDRTKVKVQDFCQTREAIQANFAKFTTIQDIKDHQTKLLNDLSSLTTELQKAYEAVNTAIPSDEQTMLAEQKILINNLANDKILSLLIDSNKKIINDLNSLPINFNDCNNAQAITELKESVLARLSANQEQLNENYQQLESSLPHNVNDLIILKEKEINAAADSRQKQIRQEQEQLTKIATVHASIKQVIDDLNSLPINFNDCNNAQAITELKESVLARLSASQKQLNENYQQLKISIPDDVNDLITSKQTAINAAAGSRQEEIRLKQEQQTELNDAADRKQEEIRLEQEQLTKIATVHASIKQVIDDLTSLSINFDDCNNAQAITKLKESLLAHLSESQKQLNENYQQLKISIPDDINGLITLKQTAINAAADNRNQVIQEKIHHEQKINTAPDEGKKDRAILIATSTDNVIKQLQEINGLTLDTTNLSANRIAEQSDILLKRLDELVSDEEFIKAQAICAINEPIGIQEKREAIYQQAIEGILKVTNFDVNHELLKKKANDMEKAKEKDSDYKTPAKAMQSLVDDLSFHKKYFLLRRNCSVEDSLTLFRSNCKTAIEHPTRSNVLNFHRSIQGMIGKFFIELFSNISTTFSTKYGMFAKTNSANLVDKLEQGLNVESKPPKNR